jgi:lipoic acid synthetase
MGTKELYNIRPRLNVLPSNPEVAKDEAVVSPGRFPHWLHRKLPEGDTLFATNALIEEKSLHTVCAEAKCPNLMECYSKKTATFLVLGKECTRACGFCEIDFSQAPKAPDSNEPQRVAESVEALGLAHAVITMVARDDLADGGASHVVRVLQAIRSRCPETTLETLTSDFQANTASIDLVLNEAPEIFNHNVETVRRLTPQVRHKATYERSLAVLRYVKATNANILVKSGIMVGLGETKEEVIETLQDLKDAGCDIVTIGQYLQASNRKLCIKEFVPPSRFEEYRDEGLKLGLSHVYAAPFVRSSYNAKLFVKRHNRTYEVNSS